MLRGRVEYAIASFDIVVRFRAARRLEDSEMSKLDLGGALRRQHGNRA